MTRVFEVQGLPAHLKLLLLALADEAADDGTGICVGQQSLASKAGTTDRTVRSHLKELARRGLIRKLPERHEKYRTDQHEIVVERLRARPEEVAGPLPVDVPADASPQVSAIAQTMPAVSEVTPETSSTGILASTDRKSGADLTGNGLPGTQELPTQATQEQDLERAAPRPRDEVFDALAEYAEDSDPRELTRPKARAIGVAAATIRRVAPDVTPTEIARRAALYPLHFRDATLTANALAAHWARCANPPRDRRMSPAQETAAEARRLEAVGQ